MPKNKSSDAAKATRKTSWERGENRKAARRAAQDTAARRNKADGTSPWQAAKAARATRRAATRKGAR